MISLEQVQLLETRVSKAIEIVERVTAENKTIAAEKAGLQKKLEANQKRIDELEVLVMRFKEDQGRIEDGIVAALDRLSQFEEAFEKSLKEKDIIKKPAAKTKEKTVQSDIQSAEAGESSREIYFDITEKDAEKESKSSDESSPSNDDDSDDDDNNDEDASQEDLSPEGELDIF